jgi:hypothetical protein
VVAAMIGGTREGMAIPTPGTGWANRAGNRHDEGGESSRVPDPVLHKEVQRKESGYYGATDVDCYHRSRPVGHERHNVAHAEKFDDLARPDLSFRQLCEGDVEIAADQRSQQHSAAPELRPSLA